jgi:glutamyl-tRNA synthetase
LFFEAFITTLSSIENWELTTIEDSFKALATAKNIKPGELQLPLRIMLVGGKFGPPVFVIALMIGKDETIARIKNALAVL